MADQKAINTTWRSGGFAIGLVFAIALVLVAAAYIVFKMPYEVAYKCRTEDGVFEKLTVWLFGLSIGICLAVAFLRRWKGGIYVTILLLVCALRELDFHIRATTLDRVEKINSTRYWRSDDVGLFEKLLIALILAAFGFAVVNFLRGSWRSWFDALKRGRPYAISIAGIMTFTLISFVLDNRLDMDALDKRQDMVVLFFSLVEETIEIGIPLLACIALVQWARADSLSPGHTTASLPPADGDTAEQPPKHD